MLDSSFFQLTLLDIYRPGVVGVTFRDFNLLHRSFLKRFPLFIWLLFAISSVSNFCPDTGGRGGGGLLFRFASSAQSCCGEGGALQTDVAVCGEHSPCSGHTGFALHKGVCAFPVYTAQAPGCSIWSGPCVQCSSSFRVLHKSTDSVAPVFCALPGLSGSGSQRLGCPLLGAVHLFPLPSSPGSQRLGRPLLGVVHLFPQPSSPGSQRLGRPLPDAARLFPPRRMARASSGLGALSPGAVHLFPPRPLRAPPPVDLRKSLDRNRGPVCRVGGGGLSGAEFAPFPSPCLLPSAGMGRLFSGVSQSLCFANCRRCVPAG